MKFSVALIVAAATAAFAAPAPAAEPQGGICFDSFDCLLSGGGSCVDFKCVAAGDPSLDPTGGICFDSFDCLLSGGGSCVNFKCVKKSS